MRPGPGRDGEIRRDEARIEGLLVETDRIQYRMRKAQPHIHAATSSVVDHRAIAEADGEEVIAIAPHDFFFTRLGQLRPDAEQASQNSSFCR